MPFLCRAEPCRKVFRMCLLIHTVRPCLIHTCHAMPMPSPCRALTIPFFSRPRHSTAVDRRPVGYLLPATTRSSKRLLLQSYQSSSQRSIRTTVESGTSTRQKRRSIKLLEKHFGYFRLPCGLWRRTRHCRRMAGARHGMCELMARYGRGTAWARHVMCAVKQHGQLKQWPYYSLLP
jgi:hypothetical protein